MVKARLLLLFLLLATSCQRQSDLRNRFKETKSSASFSVSIPEPHRHQRDQIVVEVEVKVDGTDPLALDVGLFRCAQLDRAKFTVYGWFEGPSRIVTIPPNGTFSTTLVTKAFGDIDDFGHNEELWSVHPPGIYRMFLYYYAPAEPTCDYMWTSTNGDDCVSPPIDVLLE